jgi:hypothetical protein
MNNLQFYQKQLTRLPNLKLDDIYHCDQFLLGILSAQVSESEWKDSVNLAIESFLTLHARNKARKDHEYVTGVSKTGA